MLTIITPQRYAHIRFCSGNSGTKFEFLSELPELLIQTLPQTTYKSEVCLEVHAIGRQQRRRCFFLLLGVRARRRAGCRGVAAGRVGGTVNAGAGRQLCRRQRLELLALNRIFEDL